MDTNPFRPDSADVHRRVAPDTDWSVDPFADEALADDSFADDPLRDERLDAAPVAPPARAPHPIDVASPQRVGWAGVLARVMRPWLDPRPGELRGAIVLLALSLALTLALWFDASRRPELGSGTGTTSAPVPLERDTTLAGPDPFDWGVPGPAQAATSKALVVVHVTGAVRIAGLVSLPEGSRVGDGIDAAGGVLPDARIDRLNLARVLVDGEHVHVPRVGEDAPLPVDAPSQGLLPDGRIDLNRATAAELETLPGVGPARAQAIIAERENRPFAVPGDLRRVPGIGEATFQRLAPLVAVR